MMNFAGLVCVAGFISVMLGFSSVANEPESFRHCQNCPEMVAYPPASSHGYTRFHHTKRRREDKARKTRTAVHPVRIERKFALGKEVTRKQYSDFIAATDYSAPGGANLDRP